MKLPDYIVLPEGKHRLVRTNWSKEEFNKYPGPPCSNYYLEEIGKESLDDIRKLITDYTLTPPHIQKALLAIIDHLELQSLESTARSENE